MYEIVTRCLRRAFIAWIRFLTTKQFRENFITDFEEIISLSRISQRKKISVKIRWKKLWMKADLLINPFSLNWNSAVYTVFTYIIAKYLSGTNILVAAQWSEKVTKTLY